MSEHRSERQRAQASEHRARNERGAQRLGNRSGANEAMSARAKSQAGMSEVAV
jgi:hypothetical protein